MSNIGIHNFSMEKIMEAAEKSRLLCLELELAQEKTNPLTLEEIFSVIREGASLGLELCNLCCRNVLPDNSFLAEILNFLREQKIRSNLQLPGKLLTEECAKLLREYGTSLRLYYSEEKDLSPDILKILPADSIQILLLPRRGEWDFFIESWHKFSEMGLKKAFACMSSSGDLLPEEETLTAEEQKKLEEECNILLPGCMQLLCSCSIDCCGKVYPCFAMDTLLGDVRETPLKEIFFASKILSLRRKHPAELKAPCSSCPHKTNCASCAARAYRATGDYTASDPLCHRNMPEDKKALIRSLPISSEGMLPHAGRMLLIDKILYLTERYSLHEAFIRHDNPFLRPDGILEGYALPEYAAQAAALRDSVEKDGRRSPGLLCEVSKTKFYKEVKAGDTLKVQVSTRHNMDIWYILDFTIFVNEEIAAEGDLKLCVYDDSQLPY